MDQDVGRGLHFQHPAEVVLNPGFLFWGKGRTLIIVTHSRQTKESYLGANILGGGGCWHKPKNRENLWLCDVLSSRLGNILVFGKTFGIFPPLVVSVVLFTPVSPFPEGKPGSVITSHCTSRSQ